MHPAIPSYSVFCPAATASFTCTAPGMFIGWNIQSPQGTGASISLFEGRTDVTEVVPGTSAQFRGVLTDTSGGMATATLTSLDVAYAVDDFIVNCNNDEGPLTITIAREWL